MPSLHLLRHAKSSWDGAVPDRDRPLAPRGIRAAGRIAEYVRSHRISPTLVLCSPARRTRETLELIAPALPRGVRLLVEEDIYLAGARDLLTRLRRVPAATESVLVIGHNPGMHELALLLAHGPAGLLERLRDGFPTAALASLDTTGPWRTLDPGGADLVDVVVPRELDAS